MMTHAGERTPSFAVALEDIEAWTRRATLDYQHDVLTGWGAVYSLCGQYRYLIWRMWRPSGRALGFGMLNPSTAGHADDDATATRCTLRAQDMGVSDDVGGWIGWNLFGYRATDPKALKKTLDPVGDHNGAAMELALRLCWRTIAAWGVGGDLNGRADAVLRFIDALDVPLYVLGTTKDGHPRHPLYVARHVQPWLWERGA